mmetsp:Transcript_26164/g.45000  ORF Transcript_26164/g.45000 Transcript_26164/m.45000 type:complete len:93 (-) Transcript_26164:1118-1396(-)
MTITKKATATLYHCQEPTKSLDGYQVRNCTEMEIAERTETKNSSNEETGKRTTSEHTQTLQQFCAVKSEIQEGAGLLLRSLHGGLGTIALAT